MTWQPELDELRAREAHAKMLGGADKIARQHAGGRLTVRERIDGLADAGTFHEIGAIAGKAESIRVAFIMDRNRFTAASTFWLI